MITYSIISDGNNLPQLKLMIDSIHATMRNQHPEDWEILVVGPLEHGQIKGCNILPFISARKGHITAKKNWITKHAQYDTIVYAHDYIYFDYNWFDNWLKFSFENYWDIGMNVLLKQDGSRFRDWCSWSDSRYGHPWVQHEPFCPPEGIRYEGKPCLVPYNYQHTDRMYISGTYWLARKQVMLDNPLDENLYWGQGEDVEWSLRVLKEKKYKYVMNTQSICKLLKNKDTILPYVALTNE